MAVKYLSNAATWKRQPGETSGPTDDGLFVYNIPYRGAPHLAEAFRQSWQRGASCPVGGYDGLKLVRSPEITRSGPFSTATLRFEGPDPNKDPDDGDTQQIHKENQEREIILQSAGGKKGTYMYLAPVYTRTYTEEGERSTTKSFPTMDDPEVKALVDFEGSDPPLSATELVAAANPTANPPVIYTIEEVSGFTSKDNDGAGWVHVEYHTKILTAVVA